MARFYTVQSPDGTWLNSEYHSSINKGMWRPEEEKRLYRSLQGVRSALRYTTLEGFKEKLELQEQIPFRYDMTSLEHNQAWEIRNSNTQKIKSLSLTAWLDLCRECGYIITEVEV